MATFQIRCERSEFLSITVHARSHDATDFWDGNWLRATVEIAAGGFRGQVTGNLRADELDSFHEQLVVLQTVLRGHARFRTMERWLSIDAFGDGRGHITFDCILREPGIGSKLQCTLESDQTFVASTLGELTNVARAFPVIGEP